MKTIVQLSEKDIREALAEKYGCEEDQINVKASKVPSFLGNAFGMDDNYIITAEFVKKEENKWSYPDGNQKPCEDAEKKENKDER